LPRSRIGLAQGKRCWIFKFFSNYSWIFCGPLKSVSSPHWSLPIVFSFARWTVCHKPLPFSHFLFFSAVFSPRSGTKQNVLHVFRFLWVELDGASSSRWRWLAAGVAVYS
jgi:hypothetical protein